MKPLSALVALACFGCIGGAGFAQQGVVAADIWRTSHTETELLSNRASLEALANDFPDSANARARLLGAQLDDGDTDAALDSLIWFKQRGVSFNEEDRAQILDIVAEEQAGQVRDLLIAAPEVIEASTLYAAIPAQAGLVEGLFAAQSHNMLVATSMSAGAIYLYEAPTGQVDEGKWTAVQIPGANDLSGIVGEADASIGWVASSDMDGSEEEDAPFTGLMGLRTDFQNPILVPAPEGAKAIGDITMGPDATVYASDPVGGGIYRKPIGAVEMEELILPGNFVSPQGLALSLSGELLYVSDYHYGLAVVEIGEGTVARLPSDVPVFLDGIDGLWRYENTLIATQNGVYPMRIVALNLSDDGRRIIGVRVLEQAHSKWTKPRGGSISDGALYYIATGQYDRSGMGEGGDGGAPQTIQIRRLELPNLNEERQAAQMLDGAP